jgi:superfamily I DNA and RNA helicase
LIDPEDAIVLQVFADEASQDEWVANQIAINLSRDELDADDVLIVLPESYRAKRRAPLIIRALARHEIRGHLVGVNTSVDEVFQPGSVAIAHIYRAKGNEAPMVYAVDAQYGAQSFNAVTRRNTLFTAITRSRAWVRVTGWGERAAEIATEITAVQKKRFTLEFKIPTPSELATLRHVHRDRPAEAEAVIRKTADSLTTFLEAVERGEVDIEDLPPAVRTRLAARLQRNVDDIYSFGGCDSERSGFPHHS